MKAVTVEQIRSCMLNCSRRESASVPIPAEYAALDWENLDFLGWRDNRVPLRGYLVCWHNGRTTGILLRAAESTMRRSTAAMCLLCRTGQSADNITLFTTRRSGVAGRNGNTLGTYVCADLACSRNVRIEKVSHSLFPDPGRTVDERITGLQNRLAAFLDTVLAT